MDASELDALIRAVSEGTATREALLAALRVSKVAVPLSKGLDHGALPPDARPMTLNAAEGFPVIATFTAVDKAAPWIKQQPSYANVLVADFAWALGWARPPFGIAVNPGYKYSFVMSANEFDAQPHIS